MNKITIQIFTLIVPFIDYSGYICFINLDISFEPIFQDIKDFMSGEGVLK